MVNKRTAALPGEALLDAAEREIDKGNYREGAGLVWQAAMEALAAAGKRHGLPCTNPEEAMKVAFHLDVHADPTMAGNDRLETLTIPEKYPRNGAFFSMADTYREHYEMPEDADEREQEYVEGYWFESHEYAYFLGSMRRNLAAVNEVCAEDEPE